MIMSDEWRKETEKLHSRINYVGKDVADIKTDVAVIVVSPRAK